MADHQTLEFTVMFNRLDNLEDLMLIPVYSQSGEHLDEAIRIERIVKQY